MPHLCDVCLLKIPFGDPSFDAIDLRIVIPFKRRYHMQRAVHTCGDARCLEIAQLMSRRREENL